VGDEHPRREWKRDRARAGLKPRWTANASGSKSTWFEGGTAANKTAGIFRVWSTKFNEPGGLWRPDYPLTDAAKKGARRSTR
jgi:hypothetical protein